MRKVFILLFISLALLFCQKEENNRKTEYQVLTNKDYYDYDYKKNINRWCFKFRGSDYSQGCFGRIW